MNRSRSQRWSFAGVSCWNLGGLCHGQSLHGVFRSTIHFKSIPPWQAVSWKIRLQSPTLRSSCALRRLMMQKATATCQKWVEICGNMLKWVNHEQIKFRFVLSGTNRFNFQHNLRKRLARQALETLQPLPAQLQHEQIWKSFEGSQRVLKIHGTTCAPRNMRNYYTWYSLYSSLPSSHSCLKCNPLSLQHQQLTTSTSSGSISVSPSSPSQRVMGGTLAFACCCSALRRSRSRASHRPQAATSARWRMGST